MTKPLKESEMAQLIVLATLIFGGWLRFTPVLQAGFPINDGGMFYVMIEDLYANNFVLPRYTSYNMLNIPYAYPPLGFYLGALIKFLGVETIHILMFVPPLISTLSILAFFWLAHQIFRGEPVPAALATLGQAMLPRSYAWLIMGGGLTRGLGQAFLLLFLASLLQTFRTPEKKWIWFAGLLGGLVVLSHPEAAVHALVAGLVFWFFLARHRQAFWTGVKVATISGIVAMPWIVTVIVYHGIHPFVRAMQTGEHSLRVISNIMAFHFAEEPLVTFVSAMGLLGLAYTLKQREFFPSVWLVAHFLASPRSAPTVATLPLAILFAIALQEIVLPHFGRLPGSTTNPLPKQPWAIVLLGITIYLALGGLQFNLQFPNSLYVSPEERQAMDWVRENSAPASRFLVLGPPAHPMVQSGLEWFPTLAQRHSTTTLQGREWLWGGDFNPSFSKYYALHTCIYQNMECLQQRIEDLGMDFDYVYILNSSLDKTRFTPIYGGKFDTATTIYGGFDDFV